MSLWLTLETAVEALRRNVLRTTLTALGIIIGVAAVIVMMALGNGARSSIESRIRTAGTNLIIVMPGSANVAGARTGQGGRTTLTSADADAIGALLWRRGDVAGRDDARAGRVARSGNWSTQIQGASAELATIRDWDMESGAFFSDADVNRSAKVALLGAIVRDQLFGENADPTGETIRINNQPFVVDGVLARKGQSATGQDQDDTVIVPYTTVMKKLSGNTWLATSRSRPPARTRSCGRRGHHATLLRQRHRLRRRIRRLHGPDARRDDERAHVHDVDDDVAAGERGGRVADRRRHRRHEHHAGVGDGAHAGDRPAAVDRRAQAGRADAVPRGVAGAEPGWRPGRDPGGIGASFGVSQLLSWSVSISLVSVALSFACAAAIGGFFGMYPARRAAALSPIEALRYE